MRNRILILLSFILAGWILMSFKLETTDKTYYEINSNRFKNLKVLPQDISKDSLMTLMEGYNHALGVKCNHCHIKDKADDSKHPKEVARHMISFTDALNKDEFAPIGDKFTQAINCATCHRGKTEIMDDVKTLLKAAEEADKVGK